MVRVSFGTQCVRFTMSEANSKGYYYDKAKGEWLKRPVRETPFVLYDGLPLVSR